MFKRFVSRVTLGSLTMGGIYYVYILASRYRGTMHVGAMNDLARRLNEHLARAVPGFTKAYDVTKLVYFEEYGSINENPRT